MNDKISSVEYCYEKALEIIQEQYSEATKSCFAGEYEAAYWNDEEAYVNRQGAWEYPGTWYPSPVAYSDEQMIEYLVKEGLANLKKNSSEETDGKNMME